MEKTVKTQKEFDAVVNSDFQGILYYNGTETLEIKQHYPNISIIILGNSTATLWNNSIAYLHNNSTAILLNNSTASLYNNSTATLWNNSTASLYDNSSATLYNNSKAYLHNNSKAFLYHNFSAILRDNSTADLYDNSEATLYNNSKAILRNNSKAILHDNSTAAIYSSVAKVEGKNAIKMFGNHKMTMKKWITFNQAEHDKNHLYLYKRVSKDFKTQEGTPNETIWTIGKTLKVPNWNTQEECGEGKFHACADTSDCNQFRNRTTDIYIKLKVKKSDCHIFPNPMYLTNIAFKSAIVLEKV